MSYRSYTAHYLDPFVADALETELVLPQGAVTHTVQMELVLPDGAVPIPLEVAPEPIIIRLGAEASPFPSLPRPRVRISHIFAGNNVDLGWQWPYYYVPLSTEEGGDPTRPGDVIVAVLASYEELYEPTGFTLRASHLLEEEGEALYLGVFTKRIQPSESTQWPYAYGAGFLGLSPWVALSVYNISGAIDPAEITFEFDEYLAAEALDEVASPVVAAPGEVGFVALTSSPGTPNIMPGDANDPNYLKDSEEFSPGGGGFLGVARAAPFLGSVGSQTAWVSAGPMGRIIALTFILAATPASIDDGANVPVGVRAPIT